MKCITLNLDANFRQFLISDKTHKKIKISNLKLFDTIEVKSV